MLQEEDKIQGKCASQILTGSFHCISLPITHLLDGGCQWHKHWHFSSALEHMDVTKLFLLAAFFKNINTKFSLQVKTVPLSLQH